ncbi:unnamed protein product [Didymodactylos carnosus]|uniref:Uncharacterized protein n=1 Tax=Didymodactylos carnosus TaxID=1234261 RepID=A0A813WMT9_9BILA|nr:unnamed protein product [Didymodactylos carnosus]CAF1451728.1 unnamed protein product [Didymodactylos carnosus]CAF3642353.1 unnamed protein product [Didymodactylos carnosus]CAF4246343.1 unnamed protein product [Didymodactylos carnosus]
MKEQRSDYHSPRKPDYNYDSNLSEYKLHTPYDRQYGAQQTGRQVQVVKTSGCCKRGDQKRIPPPSTIQPSYRTTNRVTKRSTNQVGNSHRVTNGAVDKHQMTSHERSHRRLDPNYDDIHRYSNNPDYQNPKKKRAQVIHREREAQITYQHNNQNYYQQEQQVPIAHKKNSKCCCTII